MNYRFLIGLAGAVWALGAMGPAACAQDKVVSTRDAGQAARDGGQVHSTASLEDPAARQVHERFAQRFSGLDVVAVRRTPYGLFEVQVGMDLLYTDEKVTWVMEGPLIDAMTRRDVTRERLEKLGAVDFDELPLDLAIRQVKGKGTRKVAIFEDPNCGYCKQLRHTLESVDDVTIYTFLYPILSPDSTVKTRNVWCAADPGRAWDDWMLRGRAPAAADCSVPVDKLLALGQRLMVRGTPTLFFADGSRISGALPLEMLQARLDGRQGGG
ncbi:DsbC family protein [Bordetella sp. 2513F-2]